MKNEMRKKIQKIFSIIIIVFVLTSFPDTALSDIGSGEWIHIRRQAPRYNISSIFSDSDGNISVGAGSLFHAFDGTRWKMYSYDKSVLNNHTPFIKDSSGRLYFIDNHELVVWDKGTVTRYDNLKVGYPAVGAFSDEGILYLGSYHTSEGGIFSFDGVSVSQISDERTRSVAVDETGQLWATVIDSETGKMQLRVKQGSEWSDRSEEIEFLYPVTTNMLTVQVAPDGALWVCNLGKYGIYPETSSGSEDGEWKFYNGGGAPVFLMFDISGGVWGYGYRKLYRLDSKGDWEEVFVMESGTTNTPGFLCVTPDSTVWTFDLNNVYRYINSRWEALESKFDLASDIVTCLAYTEDGELICGHGIRELGSGERKSEGLSIRKNSTWLYGMDFDDIDFYNVFQLKLTPYGEIVAYTDGGFKMYYKQSWEKLDSLFVANQTDMIWNDEIMWITTKRGLIEYVEGPDFEFYLPLGGEFVYPLNNLTLFDERVLYMQAENRDIITYDGTEWITVVDDNGFTNDFGVTDDGTIWAARQSYLAYWDTETDDWKRVVDLDVGRFIEIDREGRIWTSGHGNTGYIENGVWHKISELSEYASDAIAFSDDGRIAINVFDMERQEFFGLFEFLPSTGVTHDTEKPISFKNAVNHPNPFNAFTTISFELPSAAYVTVDIYSITGQHVKTLAGKRFPPGRNSIIWNAVSDTGKAVSSGIYLYRISAGKREAAGKMLLVR